jgi:hypothetical protein
MLDNTKTDATLEAQKNPLADLAAELAVDVEALEERLEMVAFDATACCIINGGACHVAPQ